MTAARTTTPRATRTDTCAAAALLAATMTACAPSSDGEEAPTPVAAPFAFDTTMRTTAIVRSDVDAMLDALSRIEGWHARRRGDAGSGAVRLRAGATGAQLDAVEAELGCALPEEARALWRWRDGQDGVGEGVSFVWYHDVLPLAQALQEYRMLRASFGSAWHASWFPVLYYEQEWYFVECTAERAEASPVGHAIVEDDPGLAYANLTTLFATAAEVLATGAADPVASVAPATPLGTAEDIPAIAAIHARHNPGIPFPYYVPPAR